MLIGIGIFVGVLVFIAIGLSTVSKIYTKRQTKNALNGKYGDSTMWAAELVEEDEDQLFAVAMDRLPQNELMEIGIIAESKKELRELTVDRFEELSTEEIPEDFA